MDNTVRNLIRKKRDVMVRKRINVRHVEFCARCGKSCDRTGRRSESICIGCLKEGS